MKGNLILKEYILVDSGEVVYAASLKEAREKLSRFHYTWKELATVVEAVDYESGRHLRQA